MRTIHAGMRRVDARPRGTPLMRAGLCGALLTAGSVPGAFAREPSVEELQALSIEELGRIEVTSVAKREVPLGLAPAAIYVIGERDIQRSGATSLPEALRLAPNLHVARLDAQSYAISARGFNSYEGANKMLALVDGRSIYTPLHGGILWDQQTVHMADVDRIEVISGPAGALWGANAFNGVISIQTKSAARTQGALATAFAGNVDQGVTARYGMELAENAHIRVYGGARWQGETITTADEGRGDDWRGAQGGFRADFSPGLNEITLQGDIFDNSIAGGAAVVRGENLMARWSRILSDEASVQIQSYYDRAKRSAPGVIDEVETFDVEGKAVARAGRHTFVAGAGHRVGKDRFEASISPFFLDPLANTISITNVYVQDEIALDADLVLTLGVKYEHSSLSGGEVLPNVRLGWRASQSDFLWVAVSRAVRTPTRIDRDIVGPGILEQAVDFGAEEVIAYEAGYRGAPFGKATLSVSFYVHDYDDLRILTVAESGLLKFGNSMHGLGYGVEIWGDYQVAPWWRLSAGVNYLQKDLELEPDAVEFALDQHQGNDPDFHGQIRSHMDLSENVGLDVALRVVDDLEFPEIPGYVELDARLSWRLTDTATVAISGRNLLDDHHPETGQPAARGEVRRSVFADLRVAF